MCVHVCPSRDIECGRYEKKWCQQCPLHQQQKWIPVDERLPAEEGSYLVLHKHGGMSVASFEAYYDRMAFTSYDGWIGTDDLTDSVTHWMLLPSAPTNGGQK